MASFFRLSHFFRPATQPSKQPASQANSQAAGQPTSQPASQPSSQAAKQPASQPTKQPSSQPANRPASQPASHGGRVAPHALEICVKGIDSATSKSQYELCVYRRTGRAPCSTRTLVVNEIAASEAPEQQREDRHPHEPGQLASEQISSEKCVNGRAGREPRSMGMFVVNEIVASETPE